MMSDQMQNSHDPLEFESFDDVLIELLLVHYYNVQAHGKYEGSGDCEICFEQINNTYVLEYPCDKTHVFHRNCIIGSILICLQTDNVMYNYDTCPTCKIALQRNF